MEAWKRAQSIVGVSEGRPEHDFYRTPPGAVRALLGVESFPDIIWEPACGDGAISEVLVSRGFSVVSSDLIDRGYGRSGVDFLLSTGAKADAIITNPPFKLAQEFIVHAISLGVDKVALLLKLSFLEGISRSKFLERSPLKRVWVFRERLSMTRAGTKQGSGMIAFAWFVWEKGYTGVPTIGWVSGRNTATQLSFDTE